MELKNWLDLSTNEGKADLAQALLAMANHGGGWIVLGFNSDGTRASPAPTDFESYSHDAINGVVKKFADPCFHCDVDLVVHETHVHPVITVPGSHRVPIRAKAGGPGDKHVRQNVYYVRRPGPESAPIGTAREWDDLISRCMTAARGELLERLQSLLATGGTEPPATTAEETLTAWSDECLQRFQARVAHDLPNEKPSRYVGGFWTCSYMFAPAADVPLSDLRKAIARAKGSETGWPVWLVMDSDDLAPYPDEGGVECWLHRDERDGAHSDFWRASPDGRLFLLRGYQEDSGETNVEPGTAFESNLPLWRVGECLLHCSRMASELGIPDAMAHVLFRWTGLRGRKLGNFFTGWREGAETPPARQDAAQAIVSSPADQIPDRLVDLVHAATRPLYEAFSFREASRGTVAAELDKLRRRVPR